MKIYALFMTVAILYGGSASGIEPPRSIHIDRNDNPYRNLTPAVAVVAAGETGETGGNKGEKALIVARELSENEYTFFRNLAGYRIRNRALFGRSKSGKFVAVEKKFFSDLSRADVTRMVRNSVVVIGKIDPAALKELSPEKCAFFLLESQIINTYWHIGSDLRLVGEKLDGGIYSAWFKGEHEYYTNERNTEPLDFFIVINTVTGEMSVRGN